MARLKIGVNDLATVNPELAKQWHPTKNGDLTPRDVTRTSHKKVWWFLPYDDPNTGKHFDFEWPARIDRRKDGCPFISGQKVWVGYNDLMTTHPQLAAQWHPTKNGNLTPKDVTVNSNKSVWWLREETDTNGNTVLREWKVKVFDRKYSSISKKHIIDFL